jgi:hypothetical protein
MLKKATFLFYDADPLTGYFDPAQGGNPIAPLVEREEFERLAREQGFEYDINKDDGMLFLGNVTGLDPRSDARYLTDKVDVRIEPEVLDTEDGGKELYDLTELAEAGWVFSLDDDQPDWYTVQVTQWDGKQHLPVGTLKVSGVIAYELAHAIAAVQGFGTNTGKVGQ